MKEKYKIPTKLANDLAEDYLSSLIADVMIMDSKGKANKIRKLSESNEDQGDRNVQEYRGLQRAIFSALYKLMDGYKGYKITEAIKEGN
tara:strand:- start:169 stop:435 length:267 start_codon:yes stop_codon:yes gene_type:complete